MALRLLIVEVLCFPSGRVSPWSFRVGLPFGLVIVRPLGLLVVGFFVSDPNWLNYVEQYDSDSVLE